MKDIEEILKNSKNKKMNIPNSFTNTILNFSPNTIERENWIMKFNIKRKVATVAISVFLLSSVAYATTKVYEKIWNEPEKMDIVTDVLTPEAVKENISEEDAKQIAINKLNEIGFNSNLVSTNHHKEVDSNKIMYRFKTEDDYVISIDGKKAELFDIWNESQKVKEINNALFDNWKLRKDISEEYFMSKEEAINSANEYCKLFGFKEGEYEITEIRTNAGVEELETGYEFEIHYNKKYGDTYNPYEYIIVNLYAKDKTLYMFRTENIPYDNNPVEITKEQALEIALQVDKQIEDTEIELTKVEQMIVKMNAKAYYRLNDKEKFYAEMSTVDYPNEERIYFQMQDRIRNAWVVYIDYVDNWPDIVTRVARGQFSYFIDCTTGEIIGGDTGDYIEYR